jgi:DNA helicase HerA-like ATPase
MKNDITYLGRIIRVDSGSVEVEISDDIPSSAPIINGRLYKIGQIGTFVKVLVGNIAIFGIVTAVSNTPNKFDDDKIVDIYGSRFLDIQLIGEKVGDEKFVAGIGTYPTINDEVHIVIEKDLFEIYGHKESGSIEIGKHSSSENLSVFVDLHKLVLRHSAILGSTGSGKSNTVVSLLKAILNNYLGSRVLLIDPHGEYSAAFPNAKVFRINDPANPLYIPFWLMNYEELAYFLVGAKPIEEQRLEYRSLRERIVELKKANSSELKSGEIDENFITADSPIPFSVRKLWFDMNLEVSASFSTANQDCQNINTVEYAEGDDSKGNPEELIPAKFKPYAMGAVGPYKSKLQSFYSYEKKLLARLKDSRYDFMFNPGEYKNAQSSKDLHNLLSEWIGNDKKLTILDLSGVPFEVLDITIGLITRFVYDSMFWGRFESYTGKNRPLIIAYEEAHTYLGNSDNNIYSRIAVERIFKEGRKFGVGAMIISQRPSEISETILAQVGTFIALRLTNSGDQSIVRASSPDNLNSLINLLPSLRIGEAIILGEAIQIPSRVRIQLNEPRPASDDPKLIQCWEKSHIPCEENYRTVVKKLREQRIRN